MSAFNQWLKIPEDKLDVIKRIIMLLHNASLLYVVVLWYCADITDSRP